MCVLDKKHNKPLPIVIVNLLFVKAGTGTRYMTERAPDMTCPYPYLL